jgi:hypothetical protein
VFTTSGTYPWSFVTQIFHNGQPSHGGDSKIFGSTSGAGTAYPSGAPELTQVFSGVRVTRSLVLYVCFVDRCLYFFFWSRSTKSWW